MNQIESSTMIQDLHFLESHDDDLSSEESSTSDSSSSSTCYDENSISDISDDESDKSGTFSSWADVNPSNVTFTHNKGRTIALDQARDETVFLQEKLNNIRNKSRARFSIITTILNLYYGEDSSFMNAICQILECDYDTAIKFVGMFSLQSLMCKDIENMSIIFSTLDVDVKNIYFLPLKDYRVLWNKLSMHGYCGDFGVISSRRSVSAWEKLQNAFNCIQRELMIEGNDKKLSFVCDDDKIWLDVSGSNATDNFKLKKTKHVRDNRNGITLHTIATTGLNLPVNGQMERIGDSACKAYMRGLTYTLSGMENLDNLGGINLPYNTNTEMCLDRGYTSLDKIALLIKSGASFLGTQKRHPTCPFTYDQLLTDKDKRELLSTSGCKSQFVKRRKIEHRSVAIHAFKNGTGTISIVTSTEILNHSWDGIAIDKFNSNKVKEIPQEQFLSEIKCDGIPHVSTAFTLSTIDKLEETVRFITIKQGTAEWFLLRSFSFSSKQTDKCIRSSFPYFLKTSANKRDWENIAKIVYGEKFSEILLPAHERENAPQYLDLVQTVQLLKRYVQNESEKENNNNSLKDFITNIHNIIQNNTQLPSGSIDNLTDECVKESVNFIFLLVDSQTRGGIPKQIRTMRNFLIEFCKNNNIYRSMMCYKKDIIISTCSYMGLKYKKTDSKKTLLKQLSNAEDGSSSASTDNSMEFKRMKKKCIKSIIDGTFQTPLKGEKKESCDLGHKNETKVVNKFVNLITQRRGRSRNRKVHQSVNIQSISAVYSVGLVCRKNELSVKDSIDGIAVIIAESESNNSTITHELWGIEVKTRVSNDEANKEREFQKNVRKVSHLCSTIQSNEMEKHIRKKDERSQLLHHASVYGFQNIIFLVGDANAEIIQCDIIRFDQSSIDSYLKVLSELKTVALKWAYNNTTDSSDFKAYVEPLAKENKNIGGVKEFLSYFHLWKYVTDKCTFPLVPLKRIIPLTHSIWNMSKSGSDVCTKLVEAHRFQHPSPNMNSRASYRLLQLSNVSIQRLLQIKNCDTQTFQSVRQMRNSLSKKYSMAKTLRIIYRYCKSKLLVNNGHRRQRLTSNSDTSHPPISNALSPPPFVSPRSGFTPEMIRKRKFLEEIDQSNIFCERVRDCWRNGGHPIAVDTVASGMGKKGSKCFLCRKKTKWYCVKCHRFLCNEPTTVARNEKRGSKKNKRNAYTIDVYSKCETITYVETCYGKLHCQGSINMNMEKLFKEESKK